MKMLQASCRVYFPPIPSQTMHPSSCKELGVLLVRRLAATNLNSLLLSEIRKTKNDLTSKVRKTKNDLTSEVRKTNIDQRPSNRSLSQQNHRIFQQTFHRP